MSKPAPFGTSTPLLAPFFMPTPAIATKLIFNEGMTIEHLANRALVECRGTGPCRQRLVVVNRSPALAPGEIGVVECEPGKTGAVAVTVSAALRDVDACRQVLAVLAYALFDPVARMTVRGQPWTRPD